MFYTDKNELSPVVRALLSEPAFQIKSLEYVLGEDDIAIKNLKGKKVFSFSLCKFIGDIYENENIILNFR